VFEATVLALVAACLHAGWNLAVKSSTTDRYGVLWGQFLFGGLASAAIVFALGGVPVAAWKWAFVSGLIHIPYTVLLVRAYDLGDFSHAYPIARGTGALGAAIGGVVLLDDSVRALTAVSIVIVVAGLVTIAGRARPLALGAALGVGVAITGYTLADSRGARIADVAYYGFASGAASGLCVGVSGLVVAGPRRLAAAVREAWRPMLLGGLAQKLAYTLVLAAVRLAQVGYVTALRETSVVLAVVIGWKFLGEPHGRRRLLGASLVAAGVVVLIASV
jgi:uncharacterized membrane protein